MPASLQALYESYDTEISIHKSMQRGIYSGYIDAESWSLSLAILTQVCQGCGGLKHGPPGTEPEHRCRPYGWGYHKWSDKRPIIILEENDETLQGLVGKAEEQATRLLQSSNPLRWTTPVYLERQEYLTYQRLLFRSTQEFLTIYEQLDAHDQKTLLTLAKTLRQGDEPRIIGSE